MNTLTFIKEAHYIETSSGCWLESPTSQLLSPETIIHHTFKPGDIITLKSTDNDRIWLFENVNFDNSLVNLELCLEEITSDFFDPENIFIFTLACGKPEPISHYVSRFG